MSDDASSNNNAQVQAPSVFICTCPQECVLHPDNEKRPYGPEDLKPGDWYIVDQNVIVGIGPTPTKAAMDAPEDTDWDNAVMQKVVPGGTLIL